MKKKYTHFIVYQQLKENKIKIGDKEFDNSSTIIGNCTFMTYNKLLSMDEIEDAKNWIQQKNDNNSPIIILNIILLRGEE